MALHLNDVVQPNPDQTGIYVQYYYYHKISDNEMFRSLVEVTDFTLLGVYPKRKPFKRKERPFNMKDSTGLVPHGSVLPCPLNVRRRRKASEDQDCDGLEIALTMVLEYLWRKREEEQLQHSIEKEEGKEFARNHHLEKRKRKKPSVSDDDDADYERTPPSSSLVSGKEHC